MTGAGAALSVFAVLIGTVEALGREIDGVLAADEIASDLVLCAARGGGAFEGKSGALAAVFGRGRGGGDSCTGSKATVISACDADFEGREEKSDKARRIAMKCNKTTSSHKGSQGCATGWSTLGDGRNLINLEIPVPAMGSSLIELTVLGRDGINVNDDGLMNGLAQGMSGIAAGN